MAQLNHEPSMEDILASIKRIIAEDSEAAVTRSPRIRREMASTGVVAVPDAEPLTDEPDESGEAEAPEVEIALEPEARAEDDTADVLELTSPIADDVPFSPVYASEAAPVPPAPPEAVISTDRLMSDPAAQASRNAFAALSQMQVRAEAGAENSLEGLVSDLLRPMLREWLDRELPGLVEKMVAAEIARVSGRV